MAASTPSIADLLIDIDLDDINYLELGGSDDEFFDSKLDTEEHVDWKKELQGKHKFILFTSLTPTLYISEKLRKYGRAKEDFFPQKPNPFEYFMLFLSFSFLANIATWTSRRMSTTYTQQDMLGRFFCIWFIYGLV